MRKKATFLMLLLALASSAALAAACDKTPKECEHEGGTATCQTRAICDKCGEEYGELGAHDLEHHGAKAATCTEKGWETYDTCKQQGCDYTTYKEIAALGHDYAKTWANDDTNHWHECSRCDSKSEFAEHTYNLWTEGDSDKDYGLCECGNIDESVVFNKKVSLEDQKLLLTEETLSLKLDGVSSYASVESIKLGAYDLGKDLSSLQISNELKADKEKHGKQTLTVLVKTEDGATHTVLVPVTVVTAQISSLQEWQSNILITSDNENDEGSRVFGYYVLTENFSIGGTSLKTTIKPAAGNGAFGFRGTLEGNGKTITVEKGAETGLGIFAFLGDGAVVKNLNIVNDSGRSPGWNTNITLAQIARKTTFENVTITIGNANHTSGVRYGALTHEGMVDCALNGVVVNINGKVEALIGGNNANLSLNNCTFEHCEINLVTSSSAIQEIGHNNDIVYVADGMPAKNGEVVLSGIKYKEPTMLFRQIFSLANTQSALSLGEAYETYRVVSIVSEKGTQLNGLDYASVSVAFSSDYGRHDLIITLEKDGETFIVDLPVTVATDTISSLEEWQSKIVMRDSTTQKISGYFVLLSDISAADIGYATWKFRPNASTDVTSYGFLGTLDGNGKTITIEENGKSGLGVFTILGHGAVVKDLTVTSNSGKNPDGIDGFILARVATYTTFENVTVNINNAKHDASKQDGALCQYGFVGCTFKNFVINISGVVQTLCGSTNKWMGWKNNNNVDITINLKTAESSLTEFAHVEEVVYVAEGMSADGGKNVVNGVKLNKYSA